MTANVWVKFDIVEDKCLVIFYVVLVEWFVMIRRTFFSNIQVSIIKDDITVFV